MKKEFIYRIFTKMPNLYTDRLLLRRICRDDYHDMFEYSHRDDVTEYLSWGPHTDPDYTERYLGYVESRCRFGEFYDWAVTLLDDGKMIGTCGFTRFDYNNDCGEIGYVLNPAYWGGGYAAEAARRVITFGFECLPLRRIEARYITGNDRSLRVMEKCGMTREGVLRDAMLVRGKYRTVGVCSILRGEYEAARDNPGGGASG